MRRGTTVLLATEVYGGTAPRAAVAGGGADGQQNSREAEAARASETRASESSSRRRTNERDSVASERLLNELANTQVGAAERR